MNTFEKSMHVMNELFAKDCTFALATSTNNIPSVRFIDTYFYNGAFYVVTYALSKKVQEITVNNQVSLCNKLYRFNGRAYNIGHPLVEENKELREKLVKAFEPWYFNHNDENDENMCIVKIDLENGFFYQDGTGYTVNFVQKEAEQFSFAFDITPI